MSLSPCMHAINTAEILPYACMVWSSLVLPASLSLKKNWPGTEAIIIVYTLTYMQVYTCTHDACAQKLYSIIIGYKCHVYNILFPVYMQCTHARAGIIMVVGAPRAATWFETSIIIAKSSALLITHFRQEITLLSKIHLMYSIFIMGSCYYLSTLTYIYTHALTYTQVPLHCFTNTCMYLQVHT